MKVKLNYVEPPIKCFLHHAFGLGAFWDENDPEIMKWFCVNYNYIFASKDIENDCFSFLANYNNIPFLQKREIYGNELENLLKTYTFPAIVKAFINDGNFVEVLVDLFYMPVSEMYQREHFMHEVLIVGYDDEKESFIIRDYVDHVFEELEIEQSKIVPFENGSYYGDDVVIKIYRKRKGVFHFDVQAFLWQIRDFYESVNPYYQIGNILKDTFCIWEKVFGFEAYDKMIIYFQSNDIIDYRVLRLIQEHFEGMRKKFVFLLKEENVELEFLDQMISFYTSSAVHAEKLVLLGVKQSIIQDEVKGKVIKERIIVQLEKLIDQERQILKEFLEKNES